jgi:enoyl-[acyl-carrier protein] reductase / trans-2-enoyl-CoA reductase (NAD+)
MVVQPKIRNNICLNAHPAGCAAQVRRQVEYSKRQQPVSGPKNVLVIGSSTGYGLASRIVASFSCAASTIGIFYEKPGDGTKVGTAGWYNNTAFESIADSEGVYAKSINGDAFSDEVKEQVIELIRRDLSKIDLLVYSLASPVRTDPDTGQTFRSVIKPIGSAFSSKTLSAMTGEIDSFRLDPATPEEIDSTVKVMGGEDWARWIKHLDAAGVLDYNFMTIAYSYIGAPSTNPMYRDGTIGKAKQHLEQTAHDLTETLAGIGGRAYVSVNKAIVTRASAVIPVVPLYISLLFKVMKKKGIHEDCIHQIYRLFQDRLFAEGPLSLDAEGRIRVDELEMREDVQSEVQELWERTTNENIKELADLDGYWNAFLRFHGFGVNGIDYEADVTV